MILKCKKTLTKGETKIRSFLKYDHVFLYENKNYEVIIKETALNINAEDTFLCLTNDYLEKYFYSQAENRQLKLQKI